MALTNSEVEFLKNNSELINRGQSDVEEIYNLVVDNRDYSISKPKILFLIFYTLFGEKGFGCKFVYRVKDIKLSGVLLNRTNATVATGEGVPLVPAMYGKTFVRLYQIKNNSIIKDIPYKIEDRVSYSDKLKEEDISLVVLDTQKNTGLVESLFGKDRILDYSFTLNVENESEAIINRIGVEAKDDNEAKSMLKSNWVDSLVLKFGDDLKPIIDSVITSVLNRAKKVG